MRYSKYVILLAVVFTATGHSASGGEPTSEFVTGLIESAYEVKYYADDYPWKDSLSEEEINDDTGCYAVLYDERMHPTAEIRYWYGDIGPIQVFNTDSAGNCISGSYVDIDGKPTTMALDSWTYLDYLHRMEWEYDNSGNRVSEKHYDLDDNQINHRKYLYDENGNRISESYYDEDGNPCINAVGRHRIEWEYDENGERISTTVYDVEGKVVDVY